MKLAKCWTLGEYIQAPEFQNQISDIMVSNFIAAHNDDKHTFLVAAVPSAVRQIWSTTRESAAPRRITLDDLVLALDKPYSSLKEIYGGDEVLVDFMAEFCELGLRYCRDGIDARPLSLDELCKYHKHVPPLPPGFDCI